PQGEPQTVDRLPDAQVEQHSNAILRAVIGAAKADGHIDDKERALIDGEIEKLSGDAEMTRWFDQELRKPLDPAEVARAATTPEIGAEMYLASLLVVDDQNYMEKAYLGELARQLRLDPALVQELDNQVAGMA
ncbi:MAG: tellurite resistance TerB family protein, partial [Oceanisphaera sp.]|nr:tellurite resistance TerB family protein [Oceanisphaera sp.]